MNERATEGLKQTTLRSLRIVDTLQRLESATFPTVASEVGLAKSTTYAHLETLREAGYVVKEGERYRLSMKFFHIGGTLVSTKPYYQMIKAKVRELARTTEERAQFIIEENGYGIYIVADAESPTAVQADVHLGKWVTLHSTAAGKAIMASLPRERVEAIIAERGLEAETERTITDPAELMAELDAVSERGYATNKSERVAKQWAIGVPIVGKHGRLIGGLSISGPENRMKGERITDELPSTLLGVANEIELNLAHM